MSRLFLLLSFILSGFALYGQRYIITGQVSDPQNSPLKDCFITIGRFSTGSNSAGQYTIRTDVLPDVLTVQHPRYPYKECFIYLPEIGKDTIRLDIEMTPTGTELEEINITNERALRVYPKDDSHIIDFDFNDDDMVFICKDGRKKYRLRRINEFGAVTADIPIKNNPWNLYRDCEKRLHMVFRDSVFRIIFSEETMSLTDGQTLAEADERLAPCAAAIGTKKIWRVRGERGQSLELKIFDTITYSTRNLYTVENRRYMRWVEEYLYDEAHGGRSYKDPDQNQYTYVQERMQAALEQQQALDFYTRKTGYVPAFVLRDSLVLFDHFNDTALVYTAEGKLARTYPIIYQHHKKFNSKLILNEEGTRVFACFDYGGMVRLFEVDPDSGRLLKETKLEKHIYPIHIQVKGSFVYYMYHAYVDKAINYIYRQRLTE